VEPTSLGSPSNKELPLSRLFDIVFPAEAIPLLKIVPVSLPQSVSPN